MTQWSRTFKQATNGLPAWRTAMVDTDKVYEIGEAPTALSARVDWPAAGSGNFLMNSGLDSTSWRLHNSYGGSVFVPDIGANGALVFGATGEAIITDQLTEFRLSEDAPTWQFLQQPEYAISEAEAITADADMYYSEADYAALPSGDKIDSVGEVTFSAAWDGTYPVGYRNWIIRRKLTESLTGNTRPWFFRYEMPVYIPPAMTGTANGAIVVTADGTIYGPFSQGPAPSGTDDVDWHAETWGGSPDRRKKYLYAMDPITKVWTRLATPVPDYARNDSVVMAPLACVDEAAERVYYYTVNVSDNSLYYADFSSGLAGMTVSSPAAMTDTSGGAQPSLSGNSVLCPVQSGVNAGKKLWFFKDSGATSALILIDIGANTMRKLTITGLPTRTHFWGFSYDAAANRVHITTKHTSNGMRRFTFAIPDSYTSEGAYSVAETVLDTSGLTLEDTDAAPFQSGQRNHLHPELGVVMWTQSSGKMLAYRPGA